MGDFGFAEAWLWARKEKRIFILGGNHDDYDIASSSQNYLGDFGDLGSRLTGAEGIFFVRGAFSIERLDKDDRLMEELDGVDLIKADRKNGRSRTVLWGSEEMTPQAMTKALELYKALKPHTVLSHDCPYSMRKNLRHKPIETRTNTLLEEMFQFHQPARWFFAHYNYPRSWVIQEKTTAVCLGTEHLLEVGTRPGTPCFIPDFDPRQIVDPKTSRETVYETSFAVPPYTFSLSATNATKEAIEQATTNAQNDIFDIREGVTILTSYGGYRNSGAFRYEWSDLRRVQCFSDGTWYCIACNKVASQRHEREECHECRDWNGCGQDCTLSEIYCEYCGVSRKM